MTGGCRRKETMNNTPDENGGSRSVNRLVRVVLSRRKGWRMPPNTIKVDRSTKWGNPFKVGVDGCALECTEKFRALCHGVITPTMDYEVCIAWLDRCRPHVEELRGKNLACWCKAGTPCHADVLLDLANDKSSDPAQ